MKKRELVIVPDLATESQIGYIIGLAKEDDPQYRDKEPDTLHNRIRSVFSWDTDRVLNQLAQAVCEQLGVGMDRLEPGVQVFTHFEHGHTLWHADVLNANGRTRRSSTILIYLNDDYEGSFLDYPYLNTRIKPMRGMMIAYPLATDAGEQDIRFSHSASKITKSTKYMCIYTLLEPVEAVAQPGPVVAEVMTTQELTMDVELAQVAAMSHQTSLAKSLETEVVDLGQVIAPDFVTKMTEQLSVSDKWQQSEVYDQKKIGKSDYRTSDSIGEESMPEDVQKIIKEHITPMFQHILSDQYGAIDVRRFEKWQAVRYRQGNKFDVHADTGTYKDGNERLYTIIIGLQSPVKGGETYMKSTDQKFETLPGRVILWSNLDLNGKPRKDRMHAGLPVEEGEKIILVNWVRWRVPS